MTNSDERKKNLARLAEESAQRADDILEDELQALLSISRETSENLRFKITDTETYERLIAEVRQAADRNENARQLKERLQKGGKDLFKIAKQVIRFI